MISFKITFMTHDNNYIWFDFFRGLAAFVVLAAHLRALVFIDFVYSNSFIEQFFYFITGFGHQAVIIFFVLSGFFIIKSVHESVESNRWSVKVYLVNRLTRLWVVLIPGLLLTLMWDSIGTWLEPESFTYSGLINTLPGIVPEGKLGIMDFLGNMFFLQRIAVPTYGSNGALWSLANEFWYYILFPLLYFCLRNYYKIGYRILMGMLIILIMFFIGKGISKSFLIWLMGGLPYFLIKKGFCVKKNTLIVSIFSIITFILVFIFIRFRLISPRYFDFLLGLSTAFVLWIFSTVPMRSKLFNKFSEYVSNTSYTTYIVHLSFTVFLVSMFIPYRLTFNLQSISMYVLFVSVSLVYCYLMYCIFEKHTSSVKRQVFKLLP